MPAKDRDDVLGEERSDETRELTGDDGLACEADTGSAGNGASPWGADMSGCESPSPEFERQYDQVEADPGHPEDISPDKIERGFSDPDEEDREYTASPDDRIRPITTDMLPSDDPGAREG